MCFMAICCAYRMPDHMHCPAGTLQVSMQQAADALKVRALVDTIMARAVQQHDSGTGAPCRSTGDAMDRSDAATIATPPLPSQVALRHLIGCL